MYAWSYFFLDMSMGLLGTKSEALLASSIWNTAFYLHISFGAIALMTGWIQFSKKMRTRRLQFHRNLGKVYVVAVWIGALAGFYIAIHATGGLMSQLGFISLAVLWFFTTLRSYLFIREKNIERHQIWMIRSYALTFAAVTLRLWLPIFEIFLFMGFNESYPIIAWLCWIPNLIVSEIIIRKM